MVADLLSCLRVRVYFAILGSSRFFLSTNAASFCQESSTLRLPRKVWPCAAQIFCAVELMALHVIFAISGSSRFFLSTNAASFCQESSTLRLPRKVWPCAAQIFCAVELMASHVIFAISGSSRFFLSTNAASFCEAFSTLRLPRKVWPCAAQIFLCCRVDGLARDFLLFRAAAGYLLAPTRQVSATHLPRSACHARSGCAQLSFFVLWS